MRDSSYQNWQQWFFESQTLYTVRLTLGLTLISLMLSALIAIPMALWLDQTRTLFARWVRKFLEVFWVFPSFVYVFLVLAVLKLFRVEDIFSLRSVVFAWVLAGVPFIVVTLLTGLRDLDVREREAIQSLGANFWDMLRYFFLPKLKRVIASSFLHQSWLYLTSFSLVVLLSGGPPRETLEVGIYTATRLGHVNYAHALALSLWQILFVLIIRVGLKLLMRSEVKKEIEQVGIEWFSGSSQSYSKKILIGVGGLALSVLFLLPAELRDALITGVTLSGWVSCGVISYALLVYLTGWRGLAEAGAWISPMVLSLAWWSAYGFDYSPILLCFGIQVVLLAPWASRILYPLLDRSRKLEQEALQSIGAHPLRSWLWVEWPRLKQNVFWLAGVIFGLSLAEVSTVILFSRGGFEPLSVWIQNQLMRFQLDQAFYGTLLLMAVSMGAILWVRRDHEAR